MSKEKTCDCPDEAKVELPGEIMRPGPVEPETESDSSTNIDVPDRPDSDYHEEEFATKLESLINHTCMENPSDTPDFILAKYVQSCLKNFAETIKARDEWYDFKPWERNE